MDADQTAVAFLGGLPSADAIRAELERRAGGRFRTIFPDVGPYRRELYQKHMEFIRLGATHRERLFLKANRTGGTVLGAYEVTAHATGRYPHWWDGRRFKGAANCWVAGDTAETTRNILQMELLGPPGQPHLQGSAMLPADAIYHTTPGRISNAVGVVYVRHISGDLSTIEFKSFDQRRQSFQGTQKHVIWLDEECPDDIYGECLMRTAETGEFEGGIVLLTFTPLLGLTALVASFLEDRALEDIARERLQTVLEWRNDPRSRVGADL